MEGITRPSITRLARRAGIKSVSDECFDTIRVMIDIKLNEILTTSLVVNSEHQTKTLMPDNIYEALHLIGYNVAQSSDIGISTCLK
jgi:histone H3/H4